jgi:hypothetical protein
MWLKTSIACGFAAAISLYAGASGAPPPAAAQPAHHCAGDASAHAQKLLLFHFGPDGRIEIDESVRVLPPIRNPANRAQRFDVLEMWGHIYKAQYRMRFIYAGSPSDCVLMGQEILEYASL